MSSPSEWKASKIEEQLTACRHQIDEIDLRLLSLLNERTRVVEVIGRLKREANLAVYEPKREEEVYHNVLGNNSGPLDGAAVRRIFERIIDEMRTLQKSRMRG